jgi:hypothetical protein
MTDDADTTSPWSRRRRRCQANSDVSPTRHRPIPPPNLSPEMATIGEIGPPVARGAAIAPALVGAAAIVVLGGASDGHDRLIGRRAIGFGVAVALQLGAGAGRPTTMGSRSR